MRIAVIPLALFLLVPAGCGAARQSAPATEGSTTVLATVDPSVVTTKIVGGTPMQQRVLREVLAGVGGDDFTEVEIRRPDPAWGPSPADSVALVVAREESDLRRQWLSWLVAHGFAQRSHELGLSPVSYVAARLHEDDAENLGPTTQPQAHMTLADAQDAASKASNAAALGGADIDRLEIMRPNGYAFLVELRVNGDAAKFLRDGLPKVLSALGGPQPSDGPYQGDYTVVRDSDGKRVWVGAEAYLGDSAIQIGGADRWDLEGCGPYFRGGPPGRGPPPCPADSGAQSKPPPSDVRTRIVGATPKQETVLREILAGLGDTVIDEIRVMPPGDGWTPFKPHSVVIRLKTGKTDEKERGGWEAALVAEAFEARSRALHLQPVAAYETANDGIALDGPAEPAPDHRAPITRKEIESGIVSGAKESGAEIVTLRIGKPLHFAAAVSLRAEDPASFLKHRLHTFLDAIPSLSTRQYDGLYVLVTDGKGKYVWVSAMTQGDSISGGAEGARDDLAGCYPNPMYGSATGDEPPPCPVD
jgi:hypothetical protein